MRTVLVDEHRGTLVIHRIRAAADQAVAGPGEVSDHRGYVGVARKPGFDGVVVARLDLDQLRRQERVHVCVHELILQTAAEHGGQEHEQHAGGERAAADPAERPEPEGAVAWRARLQACHLRRRLRIERLHHAGPQLRGGHRDQVAADDGAQALQVLEQRPAVRATLEVVPHLGGGGAVELAVKIGLHAQVFSARHWVPLPSLSATAP